MTAIIKFTGCVLLLCCMGLLALGAHAANPMGTRPDLSFGLSSDGTVEMWASDPIGALRPGAILMVNTINVSDAAGLRAALLTAATNGQDDVIVLGAGTYATGGTPFTFFSNEPNNLTLQGASGTTRDQVVLDGGFASQVLKASCVGTCASMITLQGLTVQNGNAIGNITVWGGDGYGGGVNVPNGLTLSDVNFTGNRAAASGGGSYAGRVTVTNSTFSNNTATSPSGEGGAIVGSGSVTNSTFSNNTAGYGGAITGGDVTNSTFSNNTATSPSGGGGAIGGRGTVINSTFSNNTAAGYGGAIYGSVTVTNSTFSNNTATNGSGGAIFSASSADISGCESVTVTNSSFSNNTASGKVLVIPDPVIGTTFTPKLGISPTLVIVTTSAFSNNTAGQDGGAIAGSGSVTNSTFSSNTASSRGGAIYAIGTVTNSTFSNNTAAQGGAVGGSSNVNNSFFSSNTASSRGGAICGWGTVTNSVFSNNTATSTSGGGGAIYGNIASETNIVNNTFSGNSTMGLGAAVYMVSLRSIINSVFYGHTTPAMYAGSAYNLYNNLIDTSTGIAGSTPLMVGNIAPGAISPFVDGAKGNFRLAAGSLAIDAGLDLNSTTFANLVGGGGADLRKKLLTDLDGNPRPRSGTAVDIGAYEYSSVPTCTLTASPASIVAGGNSILTASCSPTAISYAWTGGTCAGTTTAVCTVTPSATTTYTVAGINGYGTGPAASATVTVPIFNSQSDCLFNWAEGTYPTLFAPPRAASITVAPWYYRYYSQTDAYLGTSSADNHVYYKGPGSGYSILDVGALTAWLPTAGCQ